jgi:hypothetical protein
MYRFSEDAKISRVVEADTNSNQNYKKYFLIGNSGEGENGIGGPMVSALSQKLRSSGKEDYLIFLGDNFRSNRLKDGSVLGQLDPLIEVLSTFKGNKLIVPGENEWKPKGSKGIEDIADRIEINLNEKDIFQPEKGCPIETIDVDDRTEIIIIDSQWYIENWDRRPDINDKCEIRTRSEFLTVLKDKIKKARHKNILLLSHHPLFTNGFHGGRIPFHSLYRPGIENAYVPVLGTIWSFLRSQGGISKQDRYNPLMNELMSEIEAAAGQAPSIYAISAHDRSLQYIEDGGIRQIISGTSSVSGAASLGRAGIFSSGRLGFAELRLYNDGSSNIYFYGLGNDNRVVELLGKQALPAKEMYPIENLPSKFPKTFKASVYPKEQVSVDADFERKWGKHYRYVYGLEVEAPVAILDTLYGGLEPERAGGGNQTLSLRLVDKEKKEYNLRALAKDPISFLQASGYNDIDAKKYFSDTFPADLISDFYTAAHPFGAFVIADLSHKINIKHTHPSLFYVPRQKTLGDFNKEHGDRLYMLEQKPDGEFEGSHMFGNSDEVIDTKELLEELRDDEKNRVDEVEYVRARIFDMLLGDWDRHEGQWSWSKREEGGNNVYSPIPRDRDQVFANFDGKFLESLQKIMGRTRQFGKYGPDIEFVENFSESAINLDRAIIQRSNREVWEEQTRFIQENLDKKSVSDAFASVPEEIRDEVWMGIQEYFLSRKDNLPGIVERYLDYFLRFQTLKGTDKDDIFYIDRKPDGTVHVLARRIKDGEDGDLLFDRYFKEHETEELWIYGLDDKDIFKISGLEKPGIELVLIGGLDDDVFDIENGRGIIVYDQRADDNKIPHRNGTKIRLSDNYENRIYDTELRPADSKVGDIQIGFNPDEGAVPELRFGQLKKDFGGNPFSSMWSVGLKYISLTRALDITPEFHIANIFGRWNLKTEGRITSNNYTENFFGFGNNTLNTADYLDTNRISLQRIQMGLAGYRVGPYGSSLGFALYYRNISSEQSTFVPIGNAADGLNFFVINGSYKYGSVDDEEFPTRGLRTVLEANIFDNMEDIPTTWALNPDISFWNALIPSGDLVLKNTFGGQLRKGKDIPFYQAARLGGDSGLRGYRQGRFTGENAFKATVDMFYKFKPIRTALFPLRLHSFMGCDVGRVWYTGETSQMWHQSYGAGLTLSMAAMIRSDVAYFIGTEGGRLTFSVEIGL